MYNTYAPPTHSTVLYTYYVLCSMYIYIYQCTRCRSPMLYARSGRSIIYSRSETQVYTRRYHTKPLAIYIYIFISAGVKQKKKSHNKHCCSIRHVCACKMYNIILYSRVSKIKRNTYYNVITTI